MNKDQIKEMMEKLWKQQEELVNKLPEETKKSLASMNQDDMEENYTIDGLYVEWTGCYPCLCSGEWIIKYKGQKLNIPEDIKHDHMNTYGQYSRWYFDEEYCEYDEYYYDGLEKNEWIVENYEWVVPMFNEFDIPVTPSLLSNLYHQINEEDWRSGSCGGCI